MSTTRFDTKTSLESASRVRTDPQLELTWLHPVGHVQPGESQALDRHLEAHPLARARLETNAFKRFQLAHRPGDACDNVAHIQLHYFCPRACACIGHGCACSDAVDHRFLDLEVVVRKLGVTQPEAERE